MKKNLSAIGLSLSLVFAGITSLALPKENKVEAASTVNYVVKPQYYGVESFSEGKALVNYGPLKAKKYGYIDKKGELVIGPFDDKLGANVNSFSEGLAAVGNTYIDHSGKIVKELHGKPGTFNEGLAPFEVNGLYGFIDKKFNVVIKPKYGLVNSFHEGIAAVSSGDFFNQKWGYINKNGKEIVKPQFIEAHDFKNRVGEVVVEWGGVSIAFDPPKLIDQLNYYFDRSGKKIKYKPLKYKYESNYDYIFRNSPDDKLTWVEKNDLVGIVETKTGKVIVKPSYEDKSNYVFKEGLAVVSKNEKYGYIDTKGKVIITPQFDYALDFNEGLAAIKIKGKWGYIANPLKK